MKKKPKSTNTLDKLLFLVEKTVKSHWNRLHQHIVHINPIFLIRLQSCVDTSKSFIQSMTLILSFLVRISHTVQIKISNETRTIPHHWYHQCVPCCQDMYHLAMRRKMVWSMLSKVLWADPLGTCTTLWKLSLLSLQYKLALSFTCLRLRWEFHWHLFFFPPYQKISSGGLGACLLDKAINWCPVCNIKTHGAKFMCAWDVACVFAHRILVYSFHPKWSPGDWSQMQNELHKKNSPSIR